MVISLMLYNESVICRSTEWQNNQLAGGVEPVSRLHQASQSVCQRAEGGDSDGGEWQQPAVADGWGCLLSG